MEGIRFHALISFLFLLGHFLYLREVYSPAGALAGAFITVAFLYLVPVVLVRVIERKHSLLCGLLVATAWEFLLGGIAKALAFPAWGSFLMAGIGGAIVVIVLVIRGENVGSPVKT
ncbi:hypothetical protein [Thermococcus sp. JdF3]|uniref:hypothetical protein n=1 Tax=Thermococcus sp. JdF3 TaxID=1638258 RepID=UPI00143AECFB|nr:hypothetical protein [Thermococcus sp. JdF3]NJE00849.1 hypothetical protein [Thermococcus sp. JdF3]